MSNRREIDCKGKREPINILFLSIRNVKKIGREIYDVIAFPIPLARPSTAENGREKKDIERNQVNRFDASICFIMLLIIKNQSIGGMGAFDGF
ncbi:hypothetical protein TNIN_89081 [Trichonephila inaurata madagascariensis]|uniref:Uncharacterized protein n=1 Tax=Trichonephila inaurata madagascariensis TaxID=2747483 RepID=A0A8X6I9H4_9ARAC|nr:hypothetical protein TNIN_89081 [Trichonephila inaurata madagascariensis]